MPFEPGKRCTQAQGDSGQACTRISVDKSVISRDLNVQHIPLKARSASLGSTNVLQIQRFDRTHGTFETMAIGEVGKNFELRSGEGLLLYLDGPVSGWSAQSGGQP